MKKLISITLVSLFICAISLAQSPIHIGLKGGIVNSTFKSAVDGVSSNSGTGYLGGAFARFDLPKKLIIQPEVYYSLKKSDLNLIGAKTKLEKGDLDIALLLGHRMVDNAIFKFRIMAGVFNSNNLHGKIFSDDVDWEKSSFGYQAGLGIDLLMFTLDARYEASFGDVNVDMTYSGVQIALGFKFI